MPIEKSKNYELLSYDEWEEKYKPIYNGEENIYFDTHNDEDIKFLKEHQEKNSVLNIWTLVEGDDGELFIDSGWRLVNRLEYIATEVPRESMDILVQAEL